MELTAAGTDDKNKSPQPTFAGAGATALCEGRRKPLRGAGGVGGSESRSAGVTLKNFLFHFSAVVFSFIHTTEILQGIIFGSIGAEGVG